MTAMEPLSSRGWTAFGASWLTVLAASLASALALATLSSAALRTALEDALGDHLSGEVGVVAAALADTPVETVIRLGGERSTGQLRAKLASLARDGRLHDVALLGPDGVEIATSARGWIAGPADADLVAVAPTGVRVGQLYRADDGALYLTAYAPLPGHPGWVVGVEGSGALLGAADRLRRSQLAVGVGVLAITGIVGAFLAAALVRPLARLDGQLSDVEPGAPPEAIAVGGPREVVRVALAARRLLQAIADRDLALAIAHREQIESLTQMAASVAHEVRNPLHALSLTLERVPAAADDERRAALAKRALTCLAEIDASVVRFLEISRPIEPRPRRVELAALVREVAMDPSQRVTVEGDAVVETDPDLVRQVVRNLLLNAGQAGAREVTVRIGAGAIAWIEVQDDGIGVADEDVDAIFGWFVSRRPEGQGIGLPASRRIAQALGGDLRLGRPRPATFRLTLRGGAP